MSDLTHLDAGSEGPDGGDGFLDHVTGRRARSLVDFLFPVPAKRDVGSIFAWWEKRRLPYNLIVGGAGTLATSIFVLFATIPPLGAAPAIPEILIPITIFGVLANVCYTLGSAVEILAHKLWGRDVLPIGPALYRIGLTFSVGLALLPALMILIIWVVRLIAVVVV